MKKFISVTLLSILSTLFSYSQKIHYIGENGKLFNNIEQCFNENKYELEAITVFFNESMGLRYIINDSTKIVLDCQLNDCLQFSKFIISSSKENTTNYIKKSFETIKEIYGTPVSIEYEDNESDLEISKYKWIFKKNKLVIKLDTDIWLKETIRDNFPKIFKTINDTYYGVNITINNITEENFDLDCFEKILENIKLH